MKKIILLLLASLLLSAEIKLTDGTAVIGDIIEKNDSFIILQTSYSNEPIKINMNSIVDIVASNSVDNQKIGEAALHINNTGQHLVNFKKKYHSGFGMSMVGSLLSSLAIASADDELPVFPILLGGVLQIAGAIIMFTSFHEVENAGEELKKTREILSE